MWKRRPLSLTATLALPIALACSAASSAPATTASAPADEALNKVLAELKTEGEAFAAAKDDRGPTVSALVQKMQYAPELVPALGRALQGHNGQPLVDMYVCFQVLQPLKSANNDMLRRLKGPISGLLNQRCQYKPMTTWSQATLATLVPPVGGDPKDLMKQMDKINKAREEKVVAEQPVVKHNRTASALARTVKQLLAMMADQQADDVLMQRLQVEESTQNLDYEGTLEVIKTEAIHMDQGRAKRFYDRLNTIARQGGVKKTYLNYADPNYSATANSGWKSKQDYAAVPILTVVNVLATSAKETAVKIPDVKKFEEDARRPRG